MEESIEKFPKRIIYNDDNPIGAISVANRKLGLSNVGVRINDCVQFGNPNANATEHEKHLTSFLTGGLSRLDLKKISKLN